jgi:hypothetical protein
VLLLQIIRDIPQDVGVGVCAGERFFGQVRTFTCRYCKWCGTYPTLALMSPGLKDFLARLEPPRAVYENNDIPWGRGGRGGFRGPLATSNGFDRSTVPDWDRTDHANATKHRNQTEVGYTHNSVAVLCHVIKGFNVEDGMGTNERLRTVLYSRDESFQRDPLLGDEPAS